MEQNGIQVQCPKCLIISTVSDLGATQWDCPCGLSYNLRRCSACGAVSHVSSMQQRHEPWNCTWCGASNHGYTRRNDPATATVADLGADMASHGLEFAGPRQAEQVRDTQPVLIVTTNEIPGYRITQVHGSVGGGQVVHRGGHVGKIGAQGRLGDLQGPLLQRQGWLGCPRSA